MNSLNSNLLLDDKKGFHPWTSIKLLDNNYVFMKDLHVDNILLDGSVIRSVKLVPNNKNNTFYTIKNIGGNGEHIFVNSLTKVFDSKEKKFVLVKDYCKASPTIITHNEIILIKTDSGFIKIGNEIFLV